MADGITPAAGPAIKATAGVPVDNATFATYSISDPSGDPGDQWRALINFGDGHSEGPLLPVQSGNVFAFVDSHTYASPGVYTVTVMIAVPGLAEAQRQHGDRTGDGRLAGRRVESESSPVPERPADCYRRSFENKRQAGPGLLRCTALHGGRVHTERLHRNRQRG